MPETSIYLGGAGRGPAGRGTMPLLMHADDIAWADQMERWKNDPANKKKSKAGDDRSPAFRWIGHLYHNGQHIVLPTDNLMTCLMEGGAFVPVPGGRGGKTFKAQTQSGCLTGEAYWPLLVNGQAISVAPILALMQEENFDVHQEVAAQLGFLLFLKRARIGQAKHIRVRPRFDTWQAAGTIRVTDDQITEEILRQILAYAGTYKGLGDWRPGGKTPGHHGMFTASVAVCPS